MTTNQTAIIIRECIREAAKIHGVAPSIAHRPNTNDPQQLDARNHAIRLAHAQGVGKHALAEAFRRTMQTILAVLRSAPAPARETADLDAASLV